MKLMDVPQPDAGRTVSFHIEIQALGVRKRSSDYSLNQAQDGNIECVVFVWCILDV